MNENKRSEIKGHIENHYDSFVVGGELRINDLVKAIENSYIFGNTQPQEGDRVKLLGNFGRSEHYKAKQIKEIVLEVKAEKTPVEPEGE